MSQKGNLRLILILILAAILGFLVYQRQVKLSSSYQAAESSSNNVEKSLNTAYIENGLVKWITNGKKYSTILPMGLVIGNQMPYSEDRFDLISKKIDKYHYFIGFNQRQPTGFAEGNVKARCDERVEKTYNNKQYIEWRCYIDKKLNLVSFTPIWSNNLGRIELSIKDDKYQDQAIIDIEQILNNLKEE